MPFVARPTRPAGYAEELAGPSWLADRVFDRPPDPGSELQYWLHRGVGFLGGATPTGGATQAVQGAMPQPTPPSPTSRTIDEVLSLGGILAPLLMGTGRASRTFGEPVMQQMRQYLKSRVTARGSGLGTDPGMPLHPWYDELGGMKETVRRRVDPYRQFGGGTPPEGPETPLQRVVATPSQAFRAFREQLAEPGQGPQAYQAIEVPTMELVPEGQGLGGGQWQQRTRAAIGMREGETTGRPIGYERGEVPPGIAPKQFVVMHDPATDAFSVVSRWRDSPMWMTEEIPVSRHQTLGEALAAMRYYTTRTQLAIEQWGQHVQGHDRPQRQVPQWLGDRASGRYAPLGMPEGEVLPLRQQYPWLGGGGPSPGME